MTEEKNYLRYCKKCLIPETRPHTEISENGTCSACKYYVQRKEMIGNKEKKSLLKF